MVKNVANAAFNRLYAYRQDLGASRIMRPLTRWIDTQAGPWFALVHYLEAHLKYTPPLKWAARFASDLESVKKWRKADQWRAAWRHIAGIELLSEADLRCWRELYEAEVAYADHHMGLLLDWLDQTGRLDDTFVIIVADHGENLGEHGLLNHQYCVYDTLLHVPLVLRYPGALPRGKRIPWQVQTLDIFQTILEAGGVQVPNSPSRSLLAGPPDRSLTVAEYGTPRAPHRSYLDRFGIQRQDLQKYERGFTAIRTESHKLILGTDGSRELYHWPCDHAEEMNLANEQPDLVVELETVLNNWQSELGVSSLAESSAEWEMDPDTASRLEALGYLG
jgi:arylsulfatase A-like enzyme